MALGFADALFAFVDAGVFVFVANEGNNTALRSTVNNYFSRHPPIVQNPQCLRGFHARKFFSLFLF